MVNYVKMTDLVVVVNVVKVAGLEVVVNEENNGFGGRSQCGERRKREKKRKKRK